MSRFTRLATIGMALYLFFGLAHLVFYSYLVLSGALEAPVFVQMESTTIQIFGEHNYLSFYKGLNITTGMFMASTGMMGLSSLPQVASDPSAARRFAALHVGLSVLTLAVLVAYSHVVAMGIFVVVIGTLVGAFLSVEPHSRVQPASSLSR